MFVRRIVSILVLMAIAGSFVMPWVVTQAASQPTAIGDCRFGITVANWPFMAAIIPNESVARYDLSTIGVGYYLDWGSVRNTSVPGFIQYTFVLSVKQPNDANTLSTLRQKVINNPGSIWIIGNEPDSPYDQDNVTAEMYADRFFELANIIRATDPTAKISFGTITMMSNLRLRYLDYAWVELIKLAGSRAAASALVDIWTPHGFILNEDPSQGWGAFIPPAISTAVHDEYLSLAENTSGDDIYNFEKFKQRLTAFRNWMKVNGEQNKPLWLTEFGNLLPPYNAPGANNALAPDPITSDFLQQTFDWMYGKKDLAIGDPNDDYRLVQKWFWYSLNDLVTHFGGTLIDPITLIDTPVGATFRNYNPPQGTGVVAPPPDLAAVSMSVTAISRNPTNRTLVNYRLTIRVRNHQISDFLAHGKISVSDGENPISIQPAQVARCGGDGVINVTLNNIEPFLPHNFLVKVQADGQTTVSQVAFNLPGSDFTFPIEIYFPSILK